MTEQQTPSTKAEETEESIDLDALSEVDNLIKESDPEFEKNITEMAKDLPKDDVQIETIDLKQVAKTDSRIKRIKNQIVLIPVTIKTLAIDFIKGIPGFLKLVKEKISKIFEDINEALRQFSYFDTKKKLFISGFVLLCILTVAYAYIAVTRQILSPKDHLFMLSLEEMAQESFKYDPETEVEPFYESLRVSQNMIILNKVVVNIRPSTHSGSNPMAAMEIYVEGTSSDVLVEIKDRESEIKDLLQRDIEEMTFDQLDSTEGKQLLLEKLRRNLNKVLTQGKIRRAFIKTIVIKP